MPHLRFALALPALAVIFPTLFAGCALARAWEWAAGGRAGNGAHRLNGLASRFLVGVIGAVPRVSGLDHLPGGACVLVANHLSAADIVLCLAGLPFQYRFVANANLFRFLPNMGLAAYLPVRRGDATARDRLLEQGVRLLTEGTPLLYFPEGTRSHDGALGPFKPGAFETAVRAGVPVVPVRIRGTDQVLPVGGRLPRAAPVSLTILPPLLPGNDGPTGLGERARRAIEDAP